jgi:glycine cleavage system H protein
VNEKLAAKPELINSDPYGEGWILKIELAGDLPPDLMDEADYKKVTEAAAS